MLSKSNWHDRESNSPPFYLEGILIDATFFYCIFLLRDLGVIYEEKKELALELDPNKFNFVQTAWIFHSAFAAEAAVAVIIINRTFPYCKSRLYW